MKPPSAVIICPVMYEAAGRQRKATSADISLGSPRRPTGVWDTMALMALSPSSADSYNKSSYNQHLWASLLNQSTLLQVYYASSSNLTWIVINFYYNLRYINNYMNFFVLNWTLIRVSSTYYENKAVSILNFFYWKILIWELT